MKSQQGDARNKEFMFYHCAKHQVLFLVAMECHLYIGEMCNIARHNMSSIDNLTYLVHSSSYHDILPQKTMWWVMNAMLIATQSVNACICIAWFFVVDVLIITQCYLSITLSKTSPSLIEYYKIPKYHTMPMLRFLSLIKKLFFFGSHNCFQILWRTPMVLQFPLLPL